MREGMLHLVLAALPRTSLGRNAAETGGGGWRGVGRRGHSIEWQNSEKRMSVALTGTAFRPTARQSRSGYS